MVFSSNIKLLRKRKKLTQEQAAKTLSMKRSTLSGYENEVSQPTVQALMAFSKFYNISVDTLLKIDLSKLSAEQMAMLEKGEDVFIRGSKLRVLVTAVGPENTDNIELVSEKAKAGYTTGFADPEYVQSLPSFQLPFLSKQKKYRTFQLSGDSMLPIPDKAWVTGEFVQDWRFIKTGQAYVVFTIDDGIVFKIAENNIEKNGTLQLFSLNPMYEPFEIQISEVKEVWKFVHYICDEIPEPMIPQKELINTVASLKQDMQKVKMRMKIVGK